MEQRKHLKQQTFSALLQKAIVTGAFLISFCGIVQANNVSISNVSLTNQNKQKNYTHVKFDISWDNSWRTSTLESNWDACWVFVKYRLKNKNKWRHATLNYVDGSGSGDGHTEPPGAEIDSEDDTQSGGSHGVFIHAASTMSQQNVSYNGVELRWNYGTDGVADNDRVEVSVHAIEMVYIPKGSFEIGDGNGSNESPGSLYGSTNTSVTIDKGLSSTIKSDAGGIPNDNKSTITSQGIGIDGDGGIDKDNDFNIENTDFPTGYEAFYIMKYELSQGQYTEFLNKLKNPSNRDNTIHSGVRGFNISKSGGTYSTSTPNRACNFVNWVDMAAYADWAALRPMTELEYEKASRGGVSAVYQEYAWGNTSLFQSSTYSISNSGNANSSISNVGTQTGNAQIGNNATFRPFRCGIFAKSATNKTRQETGGSIYGVMELTGNLYEVVITVGNRSGQDFKVTGDGILFGIPPDEASARVTGTTPPWPGSSGVGPMRTWAVTIKKPTGILYKGGSYATPSGSLNEGHVSSRNVGPSSVSVSGRDFENGIRLVRDAP
jgi:formylglycine-generating enzyme required for sulfatase activity